MHQGVSHTVSAEYEPSAESFESFGGLVALLNPRERLVLCVPTREFAAQVRVPLASSVARQHKILFISQFDLHSTDVPDLPVRSVCLDGIESARKAALLIKKEISRSSKSSIIVIDLTFQDAARKFFDLLERITNRIPQRTIWLVSRDSHTHLQLARLKEEADYFLEVTHFGPAVVAQFLAARRSYSAEFFLPRQCTVRDNKILFSRSILPSSIPPPVAAQPPGVQPIPFVDLLEQKHRQAFDAAGTGMAIFDLKGLHREANDQGCSILGYTNEELRTLPLSQLISTSDIRNVFRALHILRRKGRAVVETRVRRRSGRPVEIRVHLSRINADLYLAVFYDITESTKAQTQLKQQEEDWRSLIEEDGVPRAVFVNRRLAFRNRAFDAAFSWLSKEHIENITLLQLFGKKNAEVAKEAAALAEVPATQTVALQREIFVGKPAGDEACFEVSVTPLVYAGKKAIQCSFLEVTRRLTTLRQSLEVQEQFRTLVENAADAISIERNGKIVYVNTAFLNLFGYAGMEEVLGKDASVLVTSAAKSSRGRAGKENKVRGVEEIHRNDGTAVAVHTRQTRASLAGTPVTITYRRNVTDEKRSQEETERHVRALETMRTTSLEIHASLERKELYQLALSAALKAVDFELGAIYTIGGDGVELAMSAQQGFSEKMVSTLHRLNVNEGITGYAAKTREPLLLSLKEYPPYLPYKSLFEAERIQSVACLPVVAVDSIAAVMILASRETTTVETDTHFLLSALCSEIGVALANATRYAGLKESEQLFHSTFEASPHVVYRCLPNGSFVIMSSNVLSLTGHEAHEFQRYGGLWRDLIHPDDRPTYSERISRQMQGIDTSQLEYRVLPKGKATYRWVRDSFRYNRDTDGIVVFTTGIVSDITDLKKLEDGIVTSEGLKANILNSIQEGVVVFDAQLRYLDWNNAMERITGVARESVLGRGLDAGAALLKPELIRPLLSRALAGESVSSEDIPFRLQASPQERFFWSNYAPLRDPAGAIKGVVGIVTDVTGRRQLERDVRESEETLRNVIDTMGDALMVCDLQGKIWEVNREFSQVTGYARKEVLGMDFPYPWVLDEDMAKFLQWITALREKSYLRDLDMTWKAKSGQRVAISMNTTLLRNAVGEPVAMLNIGRDISERKHLMTQLERKVQENAQLYAEVQAQVHRITSLYELGKSLTGTLDMVTLLEIVNAEVSKAMPLDRFTYYSCTADRRSLLPIYDTAGGIRTYDKHGLKPQNIQVTEDSPFWNVVAHGTSYMGHTSTDDVSKASLLAVPMKSKEAVVGMLCVMKGKRDAYSDAHLRLLESIANLTEIAMERAMLYEDTVRKAREIENRNKELDDFTYVVSHDLKEPLISIEGYSKILLKDYEHVVDQDGKEYLGTVVQASTDMKKLIDDLLTLSRLGHVKESAEFVSSGAVVMDVLHDIQFTLHEKNVVVNVAPDLPDVRYNRTQLGMVFRNLISNAMKFNDKPQPRIDISVREEEHSYVFSVADNGIGIEKKYFDRIFLIFQRLQRKEDYEGTGAGLTIVKKIIENHQGRIWVDSVVGEGTTFSFTIPK